MSPVSCQMINQEILVCVPCPNLIPADQLAFIPSPKPKCRLTHMLERLSDLHVTRTQKDTLHLYDTSRGVTKQCQYLTACLGNMLVILVKRWGKSQLEFNSKIPRYGYLATTNQTCLFIYTTVIHQNTVYTLSRNIQTFKFWAQICINPHQWTLFC